MKTKLACVLLFAIFIAGSITVSAASTARGESRSQLGQVLFGRHHRHRHHHRRDNNGNVRYETMTVRKGHKIYRDTYRITYKNGREKRKRVEHVRVA